MATCHEHQVKDCVLELDKCDTGYIFTRKVHDNKSSNSTGGTSSRFINALIEDGPTYTENNALTYSSSSDARLDFFFMVLEDTPKDYVIKYVQRSWNQSPIDTLKLIANLRDIRKGKGITLQFLYSLYWLYEYHPQTLYDNLREFIKFGYWKDLLHLLMVIVFDGTFHPFFIYDYDFVKCRERKRIKKWWYVKKYYTERNIYTKLILEYLNKSDEAEIKRYRTEFAKQKFLNDKKYQRFHMKVAELFAEALVKDYEAMQNNKFVSLAAKWAPSIQLHFDKFTLIASTIATLLATKRGKLEEESKCVITKTYLYRREYQKLITEIRKYNQVTEVIIPDWSAINYSRVASKCMMKNKTSFLKHDELRFTEFVNNKKSKVSSDTLKPYELIMNLNKENSEVIDTLLMKQWNSMVDKIKEETHLFNQAVSVCDVSGSMEGIPMVAAISLTLFVMELTQKPWNSCCITFSERPEIFELPENLTVIEKIEKLRTMNWGGSTNINAVFDLIISMGVKNNLSNEEMPKVLFIFTDMEFDDACPGTTNIDFAKQKFQEHNYTCPNLILWNLRSSQSVPIKKDEKGIMVSGFSKQLLDIMLKQDLQQVTPELFLNEVLNHHSYKNLVISD